MPEFMNLQRVEHDLMTEQQQVGSCCMSQGAQTGALCWPRGVGRGQGARERGPRRTYMDTYDGVKLYGRIQHM